MTVPHVSETAATTLVAKPIALVLGATGGVGGSVGRRLVAEGWHARAASQSVFRGVDGTVLSVGDRRCNERA
jgi:uncharacterized protein YbjT (DUF2867 family)